MAVTDADLLASLRQAARLEGTWICPRERPVSPRWRRLREAGWLSADDEVVVLNTGSGLKYPETMPASPPLLAPSDRIPPRVAPGISSAPGK